MVQDILRNVFEGNDVAPFTEDLSYDDATIKATISGSELCIKGYHDGPINGYDPNIKTNMLNMSEEKDYYIHLDDMLGQEASSELYINLRKIELH